MAESKSLEAKATEEEVMNALHDLLEKNTAGGKVQLTRIATITGPGGFMSLRVGLSIANTYAWHQKIPIGGVRLDEVWKQRIQDKASTIFWIHSTKKELFFIQRLSEAIKAEPEIVSLTQLQELLQKEESPTYVGELLPEQLQVLPSLRFAKNIDSLESVLPSLVSTISYKNDLLLPWYGRGA